MELGSDSREEIEVEQNTQDGDPVVLLLSYLSNKANARVEVSCYDGNMREETLIDQIGELERYFEYENVHDPNQVRFSTTKLKGRVALWWDMLQRDKVYNGMEKIKT